MVTTIQIGDELKAELVKRKLSDRDTYEDVIWDLVEDTMELSEETKRNIEKSIDDFKHGRNYTHEQVKKKLGL